MKRGLSRTKERIKFSFLCDSSKNFSGPHAFCATKLLVMAHRLSHLASGCICDLVGILIEMIGFLFCIFSAANSYSLEFLGKRYFVMRYKM